MVSVIFVPVTPVNIAAGDVFQLNGFLFLPEVVSMVSSDPTVSHCIALMIGIEYRKVLSDEFHTEVHLERMQILRKPEGINLRTFADIISCFFLASR
jgi:hypothetical protein